VPPPLAAFFVFVFVVGLLIADSKRTQGTTYASWLPLLWLLVISSRLVSEWLHLGPPLEHPGDLLDGSPIDRAFFLGLIVAAVWTLSRRSIPWSGLPAANVALTVFLAYAALSIVWSEFPFTAFKRWVKILGHPLMVLILLSEPDPKEAVRVLFKRCAYILIPTSVLFIKYYPELGRGFSAWTGGAFNTGVTTNKNLLGALCLMTGFFFLWNLLFNRRELPANVRRYEVFAGVTMLGMISWLLIQADSATSRAALILGVGIAAIAGASWVRHRRLAAYAVVAAAVLLLADFTLDISARAVEALGRDPTLTDRTELWEDALAIPINPLVGAGFESFWLGSRAEAMWAKWTWRPNQSHSNYIETYLNGGWVGVACLAFALAGCYRKAKRALVSRPPEGRFRIGFLAILLAYGYTEATFRNIHPLFFVFFLIALEMPGDSTESSGTRANLAEQTGQLSVAPRPRQRRWTRGMRPPVGERSNTSAPWPRPRPRPLESSKRTKS
jgi:exopolysaccharide production protein ExoQ